MKKIDDHIVQHVQAAIEKVLGFEDLQQIFNSRTFKMAHYLRIVSKIKEFVFIILESYISDTKENQSSTIELAEIKKMLNYKDLRSVLNWCRKNNVFVLNQGNSQVVNRTEFTLAFYKPFLEHLKATTPNWKEQFVQFVQGDLMNLLKNESSKEKSKKYKPKSDAEKSFLSKMNKL